MMNMRREYYMPSQEEQEEDEAAAAKFIKDETRKLKKPTDPIPPVPHPKPPVFTRTLEPGHPGLTKARTIDRHLPRPALPLCLPPLLHVTCY